MIRNIIRLPRIIDNSWKLNQIRCLNLQEYQSKSLLDKYGCSIQRFVVINDKSEIKSKLEKFSPKEYVVKAQVLAGGRGKGYLKEGPSGLSGIFISQQKDKVIDAACNMIDKHLITKQTPADGIRVSKVMICESINIMRESYLAILVDRDSNGPVIVASPAGGVDIEDVAEKTPELIFKEKIDIDKGVTDEQANNISLKLGFKGELTKKAAEEIKKLYKMFNEVDAVQIEINPFVETDDKRVVNVDAKFNFDDNAAFRQKEIFSLENHEERDAREIEAEKYNLNYIGMDGNIACLVNGAGLAMATMDIIELNGAKASNFLDVGGTVNEKQVYEALRIISSDPKVESILVNIFGGIVNCETISQGLITAFSKINLKVPLIVRLEGTNVIPAKKLLSESGLNIITAENLDDAAKKAVASLRK
uniref:Succinate--CoA ligase [GDP-forming] subunit beta, mitochondrial n=1 Tax=Parastrongyloides trichosuri TaxID=131310 RepID=A0A0N4ZA49_PARTI